MQVRVEGLGETNVGLGRYAPHSKKLEVAVCMWSPGCCTSPSEFSSALSPRTYT